MRRLLLTTVFCCVTFSIWAVPGSTMATGKGRPHLFMENKGQIHSPDDQPLPQVLYHLAGKGINVSLTAHSIHYTFIKQMEGSKPGRSDIDILSDGLSPAAYETLGMDVALIGANPQAKIRAEEPQEYYENYYTSAARKVGGISNVRSYSRIVYQDVYPRIDWVVYLSDDGAGSSVKYDFVVHPGGNPADIKLKYEGASTLSLNEDGSLVASTELGRLQESKPFSYMKESGREVASKYTLADDILSFEIAKPAGGTLVIDPQVIWATYFGGSVNDVISDVAAHNGDAYAGGGTNSATNIATFGSFKAVLTLASLADAFLSKFNSSGTVAWSTYFGGSGNDQGRAVVFDVSAGGSIYLCGTSTSPDSIATTGSHQTSIAGQIDGFIAKFTPSGSLIRASYYGSAQRDWIIAADCDPQGNLFVTGYTEMGSSTSALATAGSYQPTYGGGATDGFVAKFNAAGVRQWGTYFGGAGLVESINDISVSGSSAVVITGFTQSAGLGTNGTHQPTKADTVDAFLAKFGTAGNLIWTTYYGGSDNDDGQSVSCDDSGNIYVAGTTSSQTGISTGGVHQSFYGGGACDGFIAKFSDAGSLIWGSYYGGSNNDDNDYAFSGNIYTSSRTWGVCASHGKVWLSGCTFSADAISTNGAYQDSLSTGAGASVEVDALVAAFDPVGNRLWATYFGAPAQEWALALDGDIAGNVYLAGLTSSASGLATGSASQLTNNGGIGDGFLVRIFDSLSILRMRNVRPYCIGDTFSVGTYITAGGALRSGNVFSVQLSNASGSFSAPTIIGTATLSSAGGIFCTLPPGLSGTGYKLRIISTKPVMISDTVAIAISTTFPVPVITRNGGTLSTGTFSAYQWHKNGVAIPGATSASYKPSVNGPYTVTVTSAGGCKGTSTVYNMVSVGVAGISNPRDVNVYPNPTYDQLYIDGTAAGTQMRITNMVGQQVAELNLASDHQVVSLSHLPAGIYLLTLIDRDGSRNVIRVMKK